MDPRTRVLERVEIVPEADGSGLRSTEDLVEQLMGRRPELRLAFIQANARQVDELDV
jgi:topoisomerase-4 subunit B